MDENPASRLVIGAAIEVHRVLGPGMLESVYEECLVHELNALGCPVQRQKPFPLRYKGLELGIALRVDLLVDNVLVVELKTVEKLAPIHSAQLLTYLKATGLHLGLLINFNVPYLRDGVRRVVLDL